MANNVWGPGATITNASIAVLYKVVGTSATDILIAYLIFDTQPTPVTNGTLTITNDQTATLKHTAA